MHSMTADEVRKILGLVPHPREGGCYVRTYEASEMLAPGSFADGRYPARAAVELQSTIF